MSVITLTPQETRKRNLVRIAGLAAVLSLPTALYDIYLGFSSRTGFYLLAAVSLTLLFIVSVAIIRSRHIEKPFFGVWHLLTLLSIVFMLSSSLQTNVGAEMGAALLIIVLVVSIQTLPPEKVARGAIFGVIASILTSLLVFYSPLPQEADPRIDAVTIWIARGATLAVLALAITQFRSLSLSNKLLISLLGVVILISLTFNIVTTTTTTQNMTNQVGQQLQAVAESRSSLIGDLLSGQVENLQTLALDDSIQRAAEVSNLGYSGNDSEILTRLLEQDQEWRDAVASDTRTHLMSRRLFNDEASGLEKYRTQFPDNLETFATDEKGAVIATTNITSDYYQADEEWWQAAYNNGQGKVYISPPEYDESADAISVLVAIPIINEKNDEVVGVLRTTLSVDKLVSAVIEVESIGETGKVDIIFPGEPVMQLHDGQLEEADPTIVTHIEELEQFDQVSTTAFYEGENSIFVSSTVNTIANVPEVNQLDWKTVIHQRENEALAPVREQVRLISFFGTIMAGIAALLSLAVSQRLAQPILNLTGTAREVASGNLDARASVDAQDEIGQLAETFNTMTAQLKETLGGLEQRVAERTTELEESSKQLQRRAAQFETIAQLARTITSVQDPKSLLPKITQLVSVSFGFYHVGLFLLDESRQYAVLSAANSEGGKKMLDRKHRLGVGQTGIVGYVTSTGNPRIALDTGTDAVYFDNPDLPETRSEMALPLRVGTNIIGALDVQSTLANAFSEEDVEVLSILADEVSIAIENARLFEESQRVLAEAQTAFSKSTLDAWRQITKKRETVGYALSGTSIRPLEKPLNNAEIRKALKSGKISVTSNGKKKKSTTLAVPILLRDQVIGTMNINLPEDHEWDPDEVDITQALAERVGIAIESATLLEESRRRAAQESMIGDISAKISASAEIERIMQVAVGELREALGASEVSLKIGSDESEILRLSPLDRTY